MNYKQESWDLSELGDKNEPDKIIEKIQQELKRILSFKKSFGEGMNDKQFVSFMQELEKLTLLEQTAGEFAHTWFSENTKSSQAAAFVAKTERLGAHISNELMFFSLSFPRLPQAKINSLIASVPQYAYYLKQLAKQKPFLLSEPEEKIINTKDVHGTSKLDTVYDMLTNGFIYDFQGKKITTSELVENVRNKDPNIRQQAYEILFAKYKEFENPLGEIYKGICGDWHEENVKMRGYKSSISVRNHGQDLSDKAVNTLLAVAEKNQHIFQRYFALKAKKLDIKKLRRHDLYAPINQPDKKFSYDEAIQHVLNAFKEFHSEFHNLAKRMIEKNHVHSLIAQGKEQGAYCIGGDPSIDPFVLLNFTGKIRSVETLAHELGHAIHYMLASKKHNILHIHATMPIAETASIFSELLLAEHFKQDKEAHKALLFNQLDDLYASIGRQIEFVLFEREAHEAVAKDASVDDLKNLYITRLRKHFGKNVEVADCFANEWNYIPHIHHTPFYCYAYGFGNLLALSAFAAYKKKPVFREKIIEMFAEGGSMPPHDLVKILGFDIEDAKFWQQGFDMIEKMVEEAEFS